MKNLTLTQAILNFSFSTDSGTPTEHLQLVSSKNIHWFRFYDFFSVKFCVEFFLTVSYLTNYPIARPSEDVVNLSGHLVHSYYYKNKSPTESFDSSLLC